MITVDCDQCGCVRFTKVSDGGEKRFECNDCGETIMVLER